MLNKEKHVPLMKWRKVSLIIIDGCTAPKRVLFRAETLAVIPVYIFYTGDTVDYLVYSFPSTHHTHPGLIHNVLESNSFFPSLTSAFSRLVIHFLSRISPIEQRRKCHLGGGDGDEWKCSGTEKVHIGSSLLFSPHRYKIRGTNSG